jgi:hypothetical protein
VYLAYAVCIIIFELTRIINAQSGRSSILCMPSALAYQGVPRYTEFRVAVYAQVPGARYDLRDIPRFVNGERAEVDFRISNRDESPAPLTLTFDCRCALDSGASGYHPPFCQMYLSMMTVRSWESLTGDNVSLTGGAAKYPMWLTVD